MKGTIVGQYRIVRRIGVGGMGVVYLAEHVLVGRRAAIKVLRPEFSVQRGVVTRFFNEARAMTSIPDPGIVQMYDFGFHSEGSAYIVMELLEGETLEHRLRRLGPLELVDAVRVTRQLAGSLATAHAAGVIHRDLKPENIFIVRDAEALGGERPKVLDFGVAKLSGDFDRSQTMAGTMVGTPAYMSPEQCRGAREVDTRSDIYALGCVLARLVTGRLPFVRSGMGELISAHMNDAPARPSDVAPGLPTEIDDIVLRCLAKSPDDRFQTMLELQAACDGLYLQLSSRDAPATTGTLSASMPVGSRSVIPRRATPPLGTLTSNPTTLSSAVGVTAPSAAAPSPRRLGVWIGLGGLIVGAGIAAAIAMTGGNAPARPAAVAAPAFSPVSASPAMAAPALDGPIAADAGAAIGAAVVDAAVVPSDDVQAPAAAEKAAAPAAKSRSKPTSQRPPRADDLYDDR
jgi:serine/threonine protein kinase